MALPVLPIWSLFAASGMSSILGGVWRRKGLKNNSKEQNYIASLNLTYEKSNRIKKERRRMSLARAQAGISGTALAGSSLIIAQADHEAFRRDMWYIEKNAWFEAHARDAEFEGQISNLNYSTGRTLLDTAVSLGKYNIFKEKSESLYPYKRTPKI